MKKAVTCEKDEYYKTMIENLAKQWREDPTSIAEYIKWNAQYYRYSAKNAALIHSQNPGAKYPGSFEFWKKLGYSVRRGEHGMWIRVPVQVKSYRDDNNKLQPVKYAPADIAKKIKDGLIPVETKTVFKWGTVFDIASTTVPAEDYPRILSVGCASLSAAQAFEALRNYSVTVLAVPVTVEDVKDITLHGYYILSEKRIVISDLLADTHRLQTLCHEIGHALLHHNHLSNIGIPKSQIEFEADAMCCLLCYKFGTDPDESTQRHMGLSYQQTIELGSGWQIDDSLNRVMGAYRDHMADMNWNIMAVQDPDVNQTIDIKAKDDTIAYQVNGLIPPEMSMHGI